MTEAQEFLKRIFEPGMQRSLLENASIPVMLFIAVQLRNFLHLLSTEREIKYVQILSYVIRVA